MARKNAAMAEDQNDLVDDQVDDEDDDLENDLDDIVEQALDEDAEGDDDGDDGDEPRAEREEDAPAEPGPLDAPADWPAHYKAVYNDLPEQAKKVLLETNQNLVGVFNERMREISHMKQNFAQVEQIITPRDAAYKNYGFQGGAVEGLGVAMSWMDAFMQDAPTTIAKLIADSGQADRIFRMVPKFQGEQGEQNRVLEELQSLKSKMSQDEQNRAIAERRQQYVQLFEQYEQQQTPDGLEMYPLFRQALPTMKALMDKGMVQYNDFNSAYQMAFRVNGQLSQALQTWFEGQQKSGRIKKSPASGPKQPVRQTRTSRRVSSRTSAAQPDDDGDNDLDSIVSDSVMATMDN